MQKKIDSTHWYQYSPVELLSKGFLTTLSNKYFEKNYSFWISCNDQFHHDIYLLDLKTSENPLYKISLKEKKASYTINTITNLKNNLSLLPTKLISKENISFLSLTKIEDPDYIPGPLQSRDLNFNCV